MDLMNNMGDYQTKDSPDKIIWENYTTISPEKHDSSREKGMSHLSEGHWAVAESQRGMKQDKVKTVCQGTMPWKTGIFLRGVVELFSGVSASCC